MVWFNDFIEVNLVRKARSSGAGQHASETRRAGIQPACAGTVDTAQWQAVPPGSCTGGCAAAVPTVVMAPPVNPDLPSDPGLADQAVR